MYMIVYEIIISKSCEQEIGNNYFSLHQNKYALEM